MIILQLLYLLIIRANIGTLEKDDDYTYTLYVPKYTKNIGKAKVTKVTSQLNILPTVLNLYGFTYNTNNYIAKDALDNKYDGIVFFNDYSWYDGNVYVENGMVTNNKKISPTLLEEKNEYVNYLAKKNDLTLKYNYFKKSN